MRLSLSCLTSARGVVCSGEGCVVSFQASVASLLALRLRPHISLSGEVGSCDAAPRARGDVAGRDGSAVRRKDEWTRYEE
jgi:hypothetical protein